jgi:uncharacterized OB-fold protein
MKNETVQKAWSFDFDFSMTTGEVIGRFMQGLKKRIFYGNCIDGRFYYPPKQFNEKTLKSGGEWLEGDGVGTVEAFTICCQSFNCVEFPGHEKKPKPPYVIGVINVADSGQCLIHYISELGTNNIQELSKKIKVGMKVKPVWAEKRDGTILDIQYFKPAA